MPKPPILPIVNWKAVFEYARDYEMWLRNAENPENADRIERMRKELRFEPEEEEFLRALPRQVNVLAIAEDWCGDVVRHVPVLQALADHSPRMQVRYINRDYPDILIRFLTNGGEAIPKFVFLNEQFIECGHWGPMPYACRDIIARGKAAGDISAARKLVSQIYDADPLCREVVRELLHVTEIASSREVTPQFRWTPYAETVGIL